MLFIDEIHRLNTAVEEILYPAMEDRELDIIIGKGPVARSIRIELLILSIGATTRAGLLSAPLRDRFGISHKWNIIRSEVKEIILRGGKILEVEVEQAGAEELAKRSRGTPNCKSPLKRVRDYAEIREKVSLPRRLPYRL